MINYIAKHEDDNMGIFLATNKQMDDALEKGYNIYRDNRDGTTTLIATPEEGYLVEKPTIEIKAKPINEI